MSIRQDRVKTANAMLRIISKHGRRFFLCEGEVSRFALAKNERVWFIDNYPQQAIYTHYNGRWRGFSHGGTLKTLCVELREYIMGRRDLPLDHLGPWPADYCGGDLWGYGDDMKLVRRECAELVKEKT